MHLHFIRKIIGFYAIATIGLMTSACGEPPLPEHPVRVAPKVSLRLPQTPDLNPPKVPDKYPDGAWSINGLLSADKKLVVHDALTIHGFVAQLHPCPPAEPVCKPAPFVQLTDRKDGLGRRLLVGGERDLDARHLVVGGEVSLTGHFVMSSQDGLYFAPDGMLLLSPLVALDPDAQAQPADAGSR